jgi:hypothetical protein
LGSAGPEALGDLRLPYSLGSGGRGWSCQSFGRCLPPEEVYPRQLRSSFPPPRNRRVSIVDDGRGPVVSPRLCWPRLAVPCLTVPCQALPCLALPGLAATCHARCKLVYQSEIRLSSLQERF